jgi:hypothetical protein
LHAGDPTVYRRSIAAVGALSAARSIFRGLYESASAQNRATQYRQQTQLDLFNAGTEVQKTEQQAIPTIKAGNAATGASGVTQAGSPALAAAESINKANVANVYSRYAGALRSSADMY